MEKTKKKRNVLFAVAAILIITALVLLPFLLEKNQQAASSTASTLSAMAETGSIRKTLSGTGTLTEQDAEEVSVPDGVSVTEYLVQNGQFVRQGDPVATVDKISVMETISAVREASLELETKMETIRSGSDYTYISAPASGRVKAVYASVGDTAQEVILQHGALAVLSLDGLMAVKFRSEAEIRSGQTVTVTLSDGTETSGRVETVVDGEVTVTFSDEYGSIGETAAVQSVSGQRLGSGSLYVHSAWKAMATGGTVYNVYAEKDRSFSIYGTMFILSGTATGGSYEELAATHREYDDIMADLFLMYQDGVLKAPCDGCVSGVDDDILEQLSADGSEQPVLSLLLAGSSSPTLTLLANAPLENREDESFNNNIGIVTDLSGSALMLPLEKTISIDDYSDPAFYATTTDSFRVKYNGGFPKKAYQWDPDSQYNYTRIKISDAVVTMRDEGDEVSYYLSAGQYYTQSEQSEKKYTDFSVSETIEVAVNSEGNIVTKEDEKEIFTRSETGNSWTETDIKVGGIYVFAFDGNDKLMFMVYLGDGDVPDTKQEKDRNDSSGDGSMPSGGSGGSAESGGGSAESGGGSGTAVSGGGSSTGTAEETLYSTGGTVILSVTPQETVSVAITVDELDILSVHLGQEAQVTLDALQGQAFTGTIIEVNTAASNEGGNSKYSATIELERNGYMLGGMNASANITIEEREDVLLIPSEALTEQNTRSYVYTAFDTKTKTLSSPISVETGLSDGLKVQILSGLQEGDTVWYSYYDTLEIKGLSGNTPGGFPNP